MRNVPPRPKASISEGGVVYAPHTHQPVHRHGDARLLVFLDGLMTEDVFGVTRRFVRGDVLFRPPFYGHENLAGSTGSAYVRLNVTAAAARRWMADQGWRPATGRLADDALGQLAAAQAANCGAEVLSSLVAATRADSDYAAPLGHVARVLANDTTSIADLAGQLGWPAHTLTRRFSAARGTSPLAYRGQARLQRALECLADASDPIADVACAAGYCDQSHLTRALKRETGLTPTEFRRFVTDGP